jgi:hypothetical protein
LRLRRHRKSTSKLVECIRQRNTVPGHGLPKGHRSSSGQRANRDREAGGQSGSRSRANEKSHLAPSNSSPRYPPSAYPEL